MNEAEKSVYQKAICPKCGKGINFSTKRNIDYTPSKADNRVWCSRCGKYVKFSVR